MDSRQVFRLKIDVLLGHLRLGMPEDLHGREL